MQAAGLAEVERAKADGRWAAAYPPASRIEAPTDLEAALTANPKAGAFFAGLKGANRYAILYRLHDTKPGAAREARIDAFVAMLAREETIFPN